MSSTALPTTMKRYILASRGDLTKAFKLETEAPVPKITFATQILIRIHALSLNARDLQIATDHYPVPSPIPDNVVPVSDGAGEVVAIGAGVDQFKVGDRVCPIAFPGHHFEADPALSSLAASLGGEADGLASEYFVCDQSNAILIPAHYTYPQAATLPIAYATAHSCLYGHSPKLQAGQTVLCLGTGGVSLAGAQLALIAGSKAIITSSSQSKLDRAKEILTPLAQGRPDAIQTIDYSKIEKWDEEVRRLTDGRGVDFVIETAGRGTIARSVRSAKRGGLVAMCGYLSNYNQIPQSILDEDVVSHIFFSAAYVRGVLVASRDGLEDLVRKLSLSRAEPVIDKAFEFEQLQEAYQYMADGKHFGKVVINV